MKQENKIEKFQPPSNNPLGRSFKDRFLYMLRGLVDLQVASVLYFLKPWLCRLSGRVLEAGCGHQPYRHFIPSSCTYQGLDWRGAEEHFHYTAPDTIYYDGKKFPFEDDSFDFLFHTEVLEHVYEYRQFLKECKRVLRPGGNMFFTVPFQARHHYIPHDYWRFTESGIERLLAEAGFNDIVVKSRGNDITVAVYKNISVIYRWLWGSLAQKVLGVVVSPFIILFLLTGHLSLRVNLGSQDDCLGYMIKAGA